MKKVIAYTDGVNVYSSDKDSSYIIGPHSTCVEEDNSHKLEASTIVELIKAGLSIDDMAKLRREGLL
jgi:hypothetical protein